MSLPISGFTAVPNPQMLAFMAAQSFVMMMQAGEGWQYGKRKQSAMTNEEFNKQTPLSIMQRQMSELKQAIPTIEESMNAMTPMIRTIVIQYGEFMKEIIRALPEALKAAQGGQTLTGNISTVGKEFADILSSAIPSIPQAHATSATPSQNIQRPLPNTFQQHINIQKDLLSDSPTFKSPTATKPTPEQLLKAQQLASDQQWKTWATKLGSLNSQFTKIKNDRDIMRGKAPQGSQWKAIENKLRPIVSQIRAMSNDYRHPNNNIRKNALALRQQIANGNYKY